MDRTMGLLEGQMMRTLGREIISTRQGKLAKLAQIEPKLELTTLAHHIDEVWLREAYRRTRKDGAVGVDGVTAAQYEAELEANLASLLERFKSGRYRAPAVRRVHIPKPGKAKKTRPIGIPTLVLGKSGSVGAAGEQSPAATRPQPLTKSLSDKSPIVRYYFAGRTRSGFLR